MWRDRLCTYWYLALMSPCLPLTCACVLYRWQRWRTLTRNCSKIASSETRRSKSWRTSSTDRRRKWRDWRNAPSRCADRHILFRIAAGTSVVSRPILNLGYFAIVNNNESVVFIIEHWKWFMLNCAVWCFERVQYGFLVHSLSSCRISSANLNESYSCLSWFIN